MSLRQGGRSHTVRCLGARAGYNLAAGLGMYLVLERQKANLALARHNLKRIENDLSV